MKSYFLVALLFCLPAVLPAQYPVEPGIPTIAYTELKQYLSLSDAQMQSLQSIQDSRNTALQNIYNQISQKYQALYQLVNAETGTAAQLGQFLLDIHVLEKQTQSIDGPYKTQAQNVLTADQKAKLPKLTEALQLQNTASQAGTLLLIDFPQPRILPASIGGVGMAMMSSIKR